MIGIEEKIGIKGKFNMHSYIPDHMKVQNQPTTSLISHL